jgi:enoyl-CoA hydratase/carnithine racemase
MIYSGGPVKADVALEYGLVDEVVDKPELLQEAAEKLLASFTVKSRTAIAYAKRSINEGGTLPLGPALELESDLFGLAWAAPDRAEGIAAYLEKRKPQWGK